jgi:hypothetical protein
MVLCGWVPALSRTVDKAKWNLNNGLGSRHRGNDSRIQKKMHITEGTVQHARAEH